MEKGKKLKALLIDDEKIVLKNLSFLLGKYCPNIEIIDLAENAEDAKAKAKRLEPDLVFLDIEMPGKTGFDFLDSVSERSFEVIFVTSFDQHAIRALRYSALDYLLKPIDVDDLIAAVNRAQERIKSKSHHIIPTNLIKDVLSGKTPTKIALSSDQKTHIVSIADIIYLIADGSYCTVQLVGEESHLMSKPLKECEELLHSIDFFRVHHSYLVNLNHIKQFRQADGGTLLMSNDQFIPISRRRKSLFENKLKEFLD